MFVSFFPNPKLFFWSAALWTLLAILLWFFAGDSMGTALGLLPAPPDPTKGASVFVFVSRPFIWFYIYFTIAVGLFAAFWAVYAPHKWMSWSILGSALIIFTTYFQVQVSVAINAWYGPFYDMIQLALSKPGQVTIGQFYAQLATFAGIAMVAVTVGVMTRFFVSHYIFRWRTAMNDYYMVIAIAWSLFGTAFLALIGIRLPGLQFRNQRVEAAYRKELVLAEDDETRAQPQTVAELFAAVRKNYFRLYFNYMYFNVGRILYLQTDNIFPYIVLAPTIVAGKITLGAMNQILNAFGQVRSSFQFLVNSWTTIVELLSIYKRLRALEAALHGEELSEIETMPDDGVVKAEP